MTMKGSRLQILNGAVAGGVIAVAGLIALLVWWTGGEPERAETEERARLVNALEVEYLDASPRIAAKGTVIPARELVVEPEVAGRVIARHPGLVAGGVVQRGDALVQIDARDYRIAHEEAETEVELARVDLEMEKGRQVVAEEEWARFGQRARLRSGEYRAARG